jgi:hypothetical protein
MEVPQKISMKKKNARKCAIALKKKDYEDVDEITRPYF